MANPNQVHSLQQPDLLADPFFQVLVDSNLPDYNYPSGMSDDDLLYEALKEKYEL